jgi:hypothetical protein
MGFLSSTLISLKKVRFMTSESPSFQLETTVSPALSPGSHFQLAIIIGSHPVQTHVFGALNESDWVSFPKFEASGFA